MRTERGAIDESQGALANLENDIGRGTIAEILVRNGIEPAPERERKTTWKEFLEQHWDLIVAVDLLLCVPRSHAAQAELLRNTPGGMSPAPAAPPALRTEYDLNQSRSFDDHGHRVRSFAVSGDDEIHQPRTREILGQGPKIDLIETGVGSLRPGIGDRDVHAIHDRIQ
jgi:hypothetical protein